MHPDPRAAKKTEKSRKAKKERSPPNRSDEQAAERDPLLLPAGLLGGGGRVACGEHRRGREEGRGAGRGEGVTQMRKRAEAEAGSR
jgi:hypothetical protein